MLDYLLSDMDVRGKGFQEVVLAPLRLTSISDILSDVEGGYPFFLFPWQLYFNVGASEHDHCHHVIYVPKWGCGYFLGLPKRRSQVMSDTLQDSYILMTLLFCLRYTSGDSYPNPALIP